jgi:serine/threonine-protein kinase RsbW
MVNADLERCCNFRHRLAAALAGEDVSRRITSLTIRNTLAEVERAAIWLHDFAENALIRPNVTSELQVVLDELLSNIMNHGLSGAAAGEREIRLQVRRLDDCVQLKTSDDGPTFDPTRSQPLPVRDRIAARRAGGVGLLFVRALVDDLHYERVGGRNRLIVTKRLPATGTRNGGCDGNS